MNFARKFMGYTGFFISAMFFLAIFISGAFDVGTVSFETDWKVLFLGALIFVAIFILFKLLFDRVSFFNKERYFIPFLILLASVPRVIWAVLVRTVPEIDFLRFHEYTKALINGDYEAYLDIRTVFPHISGFPLFQTVFYRIFGQEVWVGIFFNIFCSVLTAVVIYFLIKEMMGKSKARIGAILYALWPNQIMFSTLIASEPLFTLFYVLSFYLFFKAVRLKKGSHILILSGVMGIVAGFAQVVRPISSTFFPALIVFLFLYNKGFKVSKGYFIKSASIIISSILLYSITLIGMNFMFQDETLVPLGEVKSGMSLFAGTTIESNGMWTPEVTEILQSTNYDEELSHKIGMEKAIENIKKNPVGILKLALVKFNVQWVLDDFGLYWSTITVDPETSFTLWIDESWDNRESLYILCETFYLAVALLASICCFRLLYKRDLRCSEGISIILVVGFGLLHILAEVQSRYHYSLMPFFIILAVSGLGIFERRKSDESTI